MALAFILGLALIIAFFSMRPTLLREAADPRFHPLGVAEIEAGLNRLQDETLPMVSLLPGTGASEPAGSRLGGPIWVPDPATSWPVDETGTHLLHVAQLNFADLEPPDGFPRTGVLQVFVRHDGTGLPAPGIAQAEADGLCVRWYEMPGGGTALPVPDPLCALERGMLASRQARVAGVPLRPMRQHLPANPFVWPYVDDVYLNLTQRRPANDVAARMQNGLSAHFDTILNAYGGHWIGGYPGFKGRDPRRRNAELRGLDRVLLHLGFDKHVCIGDAGTLNVLISGANLRNRRFDRAYCSVDV
ncbi:MAG: YwqG family protein [Pseudomonadota bacterium]